MAAVWGLTKLDAGQLLVPSLAGAAVVFPCMLPMYAVGRTLPVHWLPNLVSARPHLWVWTKLLAHAGASLALSLPAALVLIGLGLVAPTDLLTIGMRCLLAVAIAISVGAAMPYSEQQPMSIVVGGFLLGVIYVVASLGVSLIAVPIGADATPLLTGGMAAIGFATYTVIARRLSTREPARA